MAKLIVQNIKTREIQEYSMSQDSIVFGRINTCDIELSNKSVSRKHAEITRESQDYFLTDLKSGNGTFLNNKKIKPLEKNLLRSGDSIRIEDYEIQFILASESFDQHRDEDTDTDIIEIKLIKKMLKALDTDNTPSIEVLNGSAAGKKMLVAENKEEFIIGRDNDADLSIDEGVISRHHAKLVRKWGGLVLTNLGSKNGTFVNNEKVEEKLLRDGDKIMLGTIKLLYRNPKDVNLEMMNQEISRKKKEAAMREAEMLAAKQLEEEKLAEEERIAEQARKEEEAREVAKALEAERLEEERRKEEEAKKAEEEAKAQKAAANQAPSPVEATGGKAPFSTTEKIMILAGIIVGIVAIAGLIYLFI